MVGVRDLLRSGRLGKLIERLRTHMAHTYGEASFKMIHAEQQHSNASVAAQLSSCGFRTKRKNQKQIAAFHYASVLVLGTTEYFGRAVPHSGELSICDVKRVYI